MTKREARSAAHHLSHAAQARPQEGQTLETVIGIALVVISALEIWLIIRVASSNIKLGG